MTQRQNKTKTYMMIFLCFAAGMVLAGCGIENSTSKTASQRFLSMSMNQQPEYQPLLTGEPQTCGMRSGRVYLKPGEECGRHSTEAHEEMLTFLSGKGVALIGEDDVAYEVAKDSIIYIPPYLAHDIKNTGAEPLVYIYCVAPITSAKDHSEGHVHGQ